MKSGLRARWSVGVRGGIAAFLLIGVAGCATSSATSRTAPPAPSAAQIGQTDGGLYAEAVRAFEEGDLGKARGIFETLVNGPFSAEIGRRALYGLAVVRLAAAKSPEEYGEAVSLWERWAKQFSPAPESEDPRMLTPFLSRIAAPPFEEAEPMPDKRFKDLEGSLGHCKTLLQAREKEADSMKSRLESREKEIRRLRHQLESLEEIHRNYEKKKQEASAP